MRANWLFTTIPVFTVLCAGSPMAEGSLPPDQQVVYHIRSEPNDPNSEIVFDVILSLSAQVADPNSVGWHIDQIECRQTSGEVVKVWTQDAPPIGSPDGLWRVQHAHPDHPQLQEFAELPVLEGTAQAEEPEDPDLDYSFSATGYSGPGNRPYANTATATFTFVLTEDPPETVETGSDEPVEITDSPGLDPT
jgi:hypothetical protein